MNATTDTNTTALSFLRAIVEHPADDSLRMVYADWLEENEEVERAEFVRVQCELATLDYRDQVCKTCGVRCGDNKSKYCSRGSDPDGKNSHLWELPRHDELRSRERELLEAFGPQWCPVLNGDKGPFLKQCCIDNIDPPPLSCPVRVRFTRGFPSSLTCSWQTWLAIAPAAVCWPMHECGRCVPDDEFKIAKPPPVQQRQRPDGSYEYFQDLPPFDYRRVKPPRKHCPACSGRGVVPGAVECENCGGDGEITPRNSGHSSCSPCPNCGGKWNSGPFLHDDDPYTKGTGRIPREFLPTMLPLEEVRLTDFPSGEWFDSDMILYWIPDLPQHVIDSTEVDASESIDKKILALEYGTRIRFVLPA